MGKTKITYNNEEFSQIPNFEGYFVSKNGVVLSKRQQIQPIVMRQMKQKDGHLYVYLYNGKGKSKKMYVHRLVLMAWIGMPKNGQEARHFNDIPYDNRIENLAWGSRIENVADKRKNGRIPIGEKSPSHRLTNEQVMDIRKRYSIGESAKDLSIEFGISHVNILAIIRGDNWSHLPLVPVVAKHSSAPKTPMSEERRAIARMNIKKAIESRRAHRVYELVPCACGCGEMVETPDSRGRKRKYIKGHFNYWKYGKN